MWHQVNKPKTPNNYITSGSVRHRENTAQRFSKAHFKSKRKKRCIETEITRKIMDLSLVSSESNTHLSTNLSFHILYVFFLAKIDLSFPTDKKFLVHLYKVSTIKKNNQIIGIVK